MKACNKFLSAVLFAACILTGCKKEPGIPPIVEPLNDNSLPSAALLGIELLETSGEHLKFRLNIAVFRDSKHIEDQLEAAHFKIDTVNISGKKYGYSNSLTRLVNGTAEKPYAALMLMDQSGSISTSDASDFRLDAARIFCLNMGAGNHTALWSFAGAGHTSLIDFTADTSTLIDAIESLRGKEGGGTPLYSSQYEAITYTKTNSRKPANAVLTFTDGQNSSGGPSSDEVIRHAQTQKVVLYNIGLGEVNTAHLQHQAVQTGGGFMYAKDARQLISIFGNLGSLLDNTASYYQTEWKLNALNGEKLFPGGREIVSELIITFPFGGQISVPFRLTYP